MGNPFLLVVTLIPSKQKRHPSQKNARYKYIISFKFLSLLHHLFRHFLCRNLAM